MVLSGLFTGLPLVSTILTNLSKFTNSGTGGFGISILARDLTGADPVDHCITGGLPRKSDSIGCTGSLARRVYFFTLFSHLALGLRLSRIDPGYSRGVSNFVATKRCVLSGAELSPDSFYCRRKAVGIDPYNSSGGWEPRSTSESGIRSGQTGAPSKRSPKSPLEAFKSLAAGTPDEESEAPAVATMISSKR
jgi:hypothetical protein